MKQSKYIIFIFIYLLGFAALNAQSDTTSIPEKKAITISADSLFKNKGIHDAGIDSTIYSRASDTITLDIQSKIMHFRGKALIKLKKQVLEAEIIDILFDTSELQAYGILDSNKNPIGFPIFDDKGEKFAGERIKFNLKSQKGLISLGETQLDEGFYFGDRIKRISATEYFIRNGYYTTCDAPEPHYHFGAKKMKFVVGEKVFVEPITFYVEDLPLAVIPIGIFFPLQSGRQSGIIVPSFYFSSSRGVVFKDMGFYLAISDYWDSQIKADIYSKGGYMLKNSTRWNLLDKFNGYLNLEYGSTRMDTDDPYTRNWKVEAKHTQKISPQEQLDVNVNFASANFNRRSYSGSYANSQADWSQQNISSRASFTKSFDNRNSLSLSYDREQNIMNGTYNQSTNAMFNIPTIKPLNNITLLPRWVRDFQTRLRLSAIYDNNKTMDIKQVTEADSTWADTNYVLGDKSRIEIRPDFSISPKLGYFTLTPSIRYNANIYKRQLTRTFTASDSTMHDSYSNGFFYEQNLSLDASLSTKIFGVVDSRRPFLFLIKPEYIGVKAFRHTYQPNVSFSWHPDQSANKTYFSSYEDAYGDTVVYNRFSNDGGGLAYNKEAFQISYSDRHVFEMKVPQGDSLDAKNYELLSLNFNGNYNFAADSLKMSNISLGFRTPAIEFLEFSGNANFTPYDEALVKKVNQFTGDTTASYQKINQYLAANGKGLARMTNLSLSVSTRFSSVGVSFDPLLAGAKDSANTDKAKPILGQRFKTLYKKYIEPDIFAENNPGYSKFNLPWDFNIGATYSYSQQTKDAASVVHTLFVNASLNFTIAETWKIRTSTGYDVINKEFRTPILSLNKDLHCWDLQFNWTPFGSNQGFYLRFGIKASQLKDLKIEKQRSPFMR
jgi:lipopolysaccharide assembly outer membrane protein LptD (OstA)